MYSCSCSHSPVAGLRDAYHPLFDKYHVDLVLQAHNHNYERTFPLMKGSGDNPTITSTATTAYTNPTGQIYVVVGTGGQSAYGVSSKSYLTRQFTSLGYLDIAITNNGQK